MAEIAGLKLIVPSSVAGSGVSVSASGKVTFTAATSVSVNGVFDSTYDNYLFVMRHVNTGAGSPNMRLRLRASGSDNSTASSYVGQSIIADGTGVSGNRATLDYTFIGESSPTQRSGLHTYLYGPYLAQPTAMRSVGATGRSNARIDDYAVTHNQSTAYDGFTVFPESNSITGALTVYGLSN